MLIHGMKSPNRLLAECSFAHEVPDREAFDTAYNAVLRSDMERHDIVEHAVAGDESAASRASAEQGAKCGNCALFGLCTVELQPVSA